MNNFKMKKKSISFLTKRRLYNEYKKVIRSNESILLTETGLRIDWVNRLWKIYTVPIEERQNIYQYGQKYLNELVKKDLNKIDQTMMALGLIEIVGLTHSDIIDDFNVRIVISYKYYNLAKRANRKIIFWTFITLASIIGAAIML